MHVWYAPKLYVEYSLTSPKGGLVQLVAIERSTLAAVRRSPAHAASGAMGKHEKPGMCTCE